MEGAEFLVQQGQLVGQVALEGAYLLGVEAASAGVELVGVQAC
nr:hypothetical protein [Micromonospora sp. DSM 115978]